MSLSKMYADLDFTQKADFLKGINDLKIEVETGEREENPAYQAMLKRDQENEDYWQERDQN